MEIHINLLEIVTVVQVGKQNSQLSESLQLDPDLTLEKAKKKIRQKQAVQEQTQELKSTSSNSLEEVKVAKRRVRPVQDQYDDKDLTRLTIVGNIVLNVGKSLILSKSVLQRKQFVTNVIDVDITNFSASQSLYCKILGKMEVYQYMMNPKLFIQLFWTQYPVLKVNLGFHSSKFRIKR